MAYGTDRTASHGKYTRNRGSRRRDGGEWKSYLIKSWLKTSLINMGKETATSRNPKHRRIPKKNPERPTPRHAIITWQKLKTRRDSLKPRRKAAWDAEGTPQSSGDPSEQRGGCEQQPCRTGRTQCGQKAEETRPTKNSVPHSDSSELRERAFSTASLTNNVNGYSATRNERCNY